MGVAELVQKDLQVKIAKEKYLGIFETETTSFSEYAKDWLAKKKLTLKPSTYRDYSSIMEVYAIPHFGRTAIGKVSRRDVGTFLDKLHNLTGKRKNNIIGSIRGLFNQASRRDEIRDNPTDRIQRFKEEKPFIDPFSFPEMKRFFEAVDSHYFPYFATAFLTGMRPNELFALKWLHVDFEMRCITVREGRVQGVEGPPKTFSSYRDVDLLDPLYDILKRHRETCPPQATHVFLGRNGRPLEVNNLRHRIWYPTLAQASLRRRTMYKTRHTFASLMLSNGEDPIWVARMLGHARLDMIFGHYGKFIRNRSRRDGVRFLQAFTEAEVVTGIVDMGIGPLPANLLPSLACGEQ
jgi:integrase